MRIHAIIIPTVQPPAPAPERQLMAEMGLAHPKPGENQDDKDNEASNQKARGTQRRAFWGDIQTGLFFPRDHRSFLCEGFCRSEDLW